MKVTVNGTTEDVAEATTIGAFLVARDREGEKMAVAINGEFAPRSTWDAVILNEGDEIEVVAPMQGG